MKLGSPSSRWVFIAGLFAVALSLPAATLTVTNTNDSGPGSLRQALLSATAGSRIEFAIGSGPQTIMPLSNLPRVSAAITIDGTTQPGYSGQPLIEIDGALVAGEWFEISGLDVVGEVRALVINNFGGTGLRIAAGTVRGCYIGTDRTGMVAKPNSTGIEAAPSFGGTGLTIGGTAAGDGNLISGNATGIDVSMSSTLRIIGNTFGSNVSQTAKLGSTGFHISAWYSDPSMIIGMGAPNVFVGAGTAIEIAYSARAGDIISDNFIGVTPAGRIIPNRTGISLYNTSDHWVGANIIKGNGIGVHVSGHSLRNQILVNSFTGNGMGIDLSDYPYGTPTLNDPGDLDTGPNNYINFPVLTRAAVTGTTTTVTGTLSTHPNRAHRIEIYSSGTCNGTGYGEGTQAVDIFDVTTDGSGNASFTRTLPWLAPGSVVTATTTSALEGTSEFSRCVSVEGPGAFAFASATATAFESSSVTVEVRRLTGAVGPASVSYAVTGGTATPGTDFTGGSGTLHFADGETSRTFIIPLTNDAFYDDNETIVVQLSNPTGGTTLANPAAMTLTIDDDDPPPAVALFDLEVLEGNAGSTVAEVRITISGAAGAPYSVPYSIATFDATHGVDFVASPGTVTFLPGELEKRIPVTIIGDTLYESNEQFLVRLTNTPWTDARVTILNDDPKPSVTVQDLTVTETDANQTATVTLQAASPVNGLVSLRLARETAQSGSDFVPLTILVWFSDEAVATVQITIAGDDQPEPNETFRVEIFRVWGDFTVGTSGVAHGVVTILNDDAGVGPPERAVAVGESGAFTVDFGAPRAEDTILTLTTDAPDAVSLPSSLVIRAGNSVGTFDVASLVADRTATIRVAFPASLGSAIHHVRVQTYARANLRFSPARATVLEGQPTTITVSTDVPHALTVGLTATGPVEVPASLTIPAGGTATFTITPLRVGAFTIDAQLPSQHGSEVQPLFGDVVTAPVVPTILGLTPSHGPTSGGTSVTVTGANLRQGCMLRFGGAAARSVQYVSETKLTAVTPPHAGGSVDVLLVCGSDTFTFRNGFGYVSEPPRLTGVQPSSGTVNGGTYVTVSGAELDSSCWVFFGNRAAMDVTPRDTTTLTAVAPYSTAARTVDLSVRCSGGTFALPAAFTYRTGNDDAPLITGLDPSAAAPGELVTVRGLNLRGEHAAAFDAARATVVDAFPDALVLRVPELPAGRVSIHVTDHLGRVTTSGPLFSVLEARPPRVASAAPTTLPAGGELDLTGDGFRPGYTFHVGGAAAAIVTLDYTRAVIRVAPDVAPGTYPIEVRNSSGTLAALGPNVTVEANGITLSSVDPRCAPTTGGTVATIRGRGFGADARVAFDGAPAADVTLLDAMTLRVRVPAGTAGPARVSVTNGPRTATITNAFTYDSPFAPVTSCAGRTRVVRR